MGPGFESPKVHQKQNIEYPFNVFAYRGIAQLVESRSPKPLVVGSSPTAPARKKHRLCRCFFQLNPPFRVGEILLRNVKFSLRSNEIAAAVGGFNFTFCFSKIFHQRREPLISP